MATKTATVLIRLTPEDRARLQRAAEANFLEPAIWARQAVLRMLQQEEGGARATPAERARMRPRRRR
jgi:hypothetical protein